MGNRKGSEAEVRAKAKAIAEDAAIALSERSTPAPSAAKSELPDEGIETPLARTEIRLVQPSHTTKYPQVYDPEGAWCGFFISEPAARAWVRLRPKRGAGYVINNTPPPRKVTVSV
jgi:hypothetical protein